MRNAYLIMAHHNFDQLCILLDLLDDLSNDLYIHIDSKAGDVDTGKIATYVNKGTITFIPRTSITWGGDSMIWCYYDLLRAASSTYHDYYHLLSGDDLPIKTNSQISAFLENNRGKQFIGIYMRGFAQDFPDYLSERFRYRWPLQNRIGRNRSFAVNVIFAIQKIFRIDRSKRFRGEYAKGSQWTSITDDFAHYVLDHENVVRRMFAGGLCCDEVFQQTLYVNSPFCQDAAPMNLRLIDWEHAGDASPRTFREEDYPMLVNSSCLFARKFNINVDPTIVQKIVDYLKAGV